MKKAIVFFAAIGITLSVSCNSDSRESSHAVKPEKSSDENIEIISNSSAGLWGENKQASLEEELIIGKEYGGEDEMFRYIRSLTFDSDDNIYVNDSYDLTIKIYDDRGHFIRSFGREGGGPGEFQTIDDIHWCGFDNFLYVADRRNNRISQFSTDGTFQKAINTSKFKARIEKIAGFDNGNFALVARRYGGNFADFQILIVDHSFSQIAAEFKENFPIHCLGMEMTPGFSDVGILSGSELYYTSPSAYEIVLFDKNLAKNKIIKKSHPRMFPPQYVHGFYADFNTLENLVEVDEKYIVGVGYTQTREIPPFQQKSELVNFVDNERRMCYQLDIFDGDFRYLASVETPPQWQLAGTDSKDRLYFIQNDPFPRLIRCRLIF